VARRQLDDKAVSNRSAIFVTALAVMMVLVALSSGFDSRSATAISSAAIVIMVASLILGVYWFRRAKRRPE
jgi:hypothetical protein